MRKPSWFGRRVRTCDARGAWPGCQPGVTIPMRCTRPAMHEGPHHDPERGVVSVEPQEQS